MAEAHKIEAGSASPATKSPGSRDSKRGLSKRSKIEAYKERNGGKEPLVAIEIFSARSVSNLITYTWVMNIVVVLVTTTETNTDSPDYGSLALAWFIGVILFIVYASAFWIQLGGMAKKDMCRYIFCRDWTRVDVAVQSLFLLFAPLFVVSYIILCGFATDNINNRNIGFFVAQEFCALPATCIFLLMTGGFAQPKLNFLTFYLPRIILVFVNLGCRLAAVVSGNHKERVFPIVTTTIDLVIYVLALIDHIRSRRYLDKQPYMETRFEQIVFRFCHFVLALTISLGIITEGVQFASWTSEKYWDVTQWPMAMLLLYPMLAANAFTVLIVGFLPPKEENRFLGCALTDLDPYKVPWGDVTFAIAACADIYSKDPNEPDPLEPIPGKKKKRDLTHMIWKHKKMIWTRRAYQYRGRVKVKESDANVLIGEVTAEGGRAKMPGWTFREGDIVVSFRGTGSIKNIVTDVAAWRKPIPSKLLNALYKLVPEDKQEENHEEASRANLSEHKDHAEMKDNELMAPEKSDRRSPAHADMKSREHEPTEGSVPPSTAEAKVTAMKEDTHRASSTMGNDSAQRQSSITTSYKQFEKIGPQIEGHPGIQRSDSVWIKGEQEKKDEELGPLQGLLAAKLHAGFLDHYMSVREELFEKLDPILAPSGVISRHHSDDKESDPNGAQDSLNSEKRKAENCIENRKRKILVTGHSLGGALATIAALDLQSRYNGEYDVEMINIASPRVGNLQFATLFNERMPDALRVVFDQDVVPGIPKFCCLYTHVGHEVMIDAKGNALVDRAPIEKHFMRGGKSSFKCHKIPAYRDGTFAHIKMYYARYVTLLNELLKKHYPEGSEPDAKDIVELKLDSEAKTLCEEVQPKLFCCC